MIVSCHDCFRGHMCQLKEGSAGHAIVHSLKNHPNSFGDQLHHPVKQRELVWSALPAFQVTRVTFASRVQKFSDDSLIGCPDINDFTSVRGSETVEKAIRVVASGGPQLVSALQ